MPNVILTDGLAKRYTGGAKEIDVEAGSVRGVVKALEERFPGIAEALNPDAMSVAIDGEIYQYALLEPVGEDSEVCFLPRIGGG